MLPEDENFSSNCPARKREPLPFQTAKATKWTVSLGISGLRALVDSFCEFLQFVLAVGR